MSSTYASETITVSTVAIGFTMATVLSIKPYARPFALVTVESQPIRWELGTPTNTTGHLLNDGDTLPLDNFDDIKAVRFIRDTTATGDATIRVTYKNGQ